MNVDLTQTEIDRYQRDGFLVCENFLSEQELDLMRDAVTTSVAEMGTKTLTGSAGKEGFDEKPDDYYGQVFVQRLNLWRINSFIEDFFTSAELGKMLCRLEGVARMRIWHDQTLQKKPWANPTAWHLDNPYWSFSSHHAISVWIALDDATVNNGGLWYLPGTHKQGDPGRNAGIGPNMGDLFNLYPEWRDIEAVPAPMKAGDAGFHNGLSAHGANANMTPGWRRAMTCAYMPNGSTFNGQKNVLPQEYVDSLTIGDTLDDDDMNPPAWK